MTKATLVTDLYVPNVLVWLCCRLKWISGQMVSTKFDFLILETIWLGIHFNLQQLCCSGSRQNKSQVETIQSYSSITPSQGSNLKKILSRLLATIE